MELYADLTSITVLPATIAVLFLTAWSLFTILFGIGGDISISDWLPIEITPDAATTELPSPTTEIPPISDAIGHDGLIPNPTASPRSLFGLLAVPSMRWLNISSIPLILWGGIFVILWWIISIATYYSVDVPIFTKDIHWFWAILILVRNFAFGLILTRFLTTPMKPWFEEKRLRARDLVGSEVVISSYDASPTHGQARYKTGGAPLLLNIQTDGPILPKGTVVWITYYDPQKRVYKVTATTTADHVS